MSVDSAPSGIVSLDNSFGSLYIGTIVAAGLWGISTAQAYWYSTAYPKDHLGLKFLVPAVWILDTAHQAIISQAVYFYMITNYNRPSMLNFRHWGLGIPALLEALTCLLVQSFFLMRIWLLSSGRWSLVLLPAIFILGKFAVGLVWIVGFAKADSSLSEALSRNHTLSEVINGLAAGGDILLAAIMTWLLYSARSGVKKTDTLLTKLMIYTVNTGTITSLCSIITLITAEVWPRTFIFAAFYFSITRLYTNTMLAALNARQSGLARSVTVVEMELTGLATTQPDSVSDESNIQHFKSV